MPYMQELIHKVEEGPWFRHLKIGLAVLAVVGLVVGYNWRSFKNFNSQEAMDSAQLARNISEGKGYTTLFVRPLSMHLLKQHALNKARAGGEVDTSDATRIKGDHPDLANPPLYPCMLAAFMKVAPMKWQINTTKPFWSQAGGFYRYEPDFLIALFNELIFFVVIALTFLLARKLFDPAVAWLSAILLLGCELLWRFSVSGLSTMLLILIFVGLTWCLVWLEEEVRAPQAGSRRPLLLAAGLGLLLGLGFLTRYSFGWLLAPVLVFLILFGGNRKLVLSLLALGVFLLVATPWIYRNVKLCGLPFGTSSLAVLETTPMYPGNVLPRSLHPDFGIIFLKGFLPKLFLNTRQLLQSELPKIGGSWLGALFLAGLLLGFRNPAIKRLRYFIMGSIGILVLVQALGRTQLSDDSPELNSENLLVLFVPLVFMYGVSLFYLLLDQMTLLFRGLRIIIVGVFAALMLWPMVFSFLPPRPSPINYPPYHPPAMQHTAGLMKEGELIMSDVPWALAWYGKRQTVWLTLDALDSSLVPRNPTAPRADENFFTINDYIKPVRGLYLSPVTMDGNFVSRWIEPGQQGWGNFILSSFIVQNGNIPLSFPLREALPDMMPKQLFLCDRRRWEEEKASSFTPPGPGTTNAPPAGTAAPPK